MTLTGNLIMALATAAIVPLSTAQQQRLAAAADGVDDRDDAFEALLDNVRQWTPGVGDAPIRLDPDVSAMAAEPAPYRGDLCRLRGRLQQQTRLGPPHEDVTEWVVRDAAGRPILVYVPDAGTFAEGRTVEISARFYKRVDATARDQRVHSYAAFVGALPVAVAGSGSLGQMWVVVVPVAVMLLVFLLLLIYAQRRGGPRRRAAAAVAAPGPPDAGLPADPAEALAELRRRAGVGGVGGADDP